jgi:Ferredoxin subunits of nitrite reductase and ring-hydroxylating dioxygenases
MKAATLGDVRDGGECVTLEADGSSRRIAVFYDDGEVHAVDDACTHAGASLSEGGVRDGTVRCLRHGAPFDVRTGESLGYPASEDIRTYEAETRDGVVYVCLNG